MSDRIKKVFIQWKGYFLDPQDGFTQKFPREPGAVGFADATAALAKVTALGLTESQVVLTKSVVRQAED
jgi:hypothetical protein